MCGICLMNPCHPSCPNAPEPPTVYICSGCGEPIVDGEYVWHILGEQFCETCIDNARTEAVYVTDEW